MVTLSMGFEMVRIEGFGIAVDFSSTGEWDLNCC